MKATYLASPLLCFLVACGGSGKKEPNVDASPPTPDAPPPSTCTAPASFSAVTNLALTYTADRDMVTAGNQEVWKAIGEMDNEAKRDLLWIELFEGVPPDYTTANFPSTPFTIQLTGAELDYLKCSTCVSITTDVDISTLAPNNLDYVDDYMASAGSVTITTLTPTMIAGTLDGITFRHVDITTSGTTPNASGCTTSLASLQFSASGQAFHGGIAIPFGNAGAKRAVR